MEFSRNELETLSSAIHQLLAMHISSDFELEELVERIDCCLEED